jgi:Ran GTPase-activating protein (RanGAP) involved in mRNA processing and transport
LHKIRNCDEPSLSLRHQGLTTDMLEVVWQALVSNSYIVDLDLGGNTLSAVAVQGLCALVLSESGFADYDWTEYAKRSPLPLLDQSLVGAHRSCIIRSLDLSSTQLKLEQVKILCAKLQTSTLLRNLSLRGNALGDSSCRMVARMLMDNISIAKLDLCQNEFTWRSAPDLAKALGTNKVS